MDLSYPSSGLVSRTHAYRKVMKPLLERKRRARMNRSLDELKELMVFALQTENEAVNKLEKADILELTVRHLLLLKQHGRLRAEEEEQKNKESGFRSGFSACANEVSRFLATMPGVNIAVGTGLMAHLGVSMTNASENFGTIDTMPASPISDTGYASSNGSVSPPPPPKDLVWRPF